MKKTESEASVEISGLIGTFATEHGLSPADCLKFAKDFGSLLLGGTAEQIESNRLRAGRLMMDEGRQSALPAYYGGELALANRASLVEALTPENLISRPETGALPTMSLAAVPDLEQAVLDVSAAEEAA